MAEFDNDINRVSNILQNEIVGYVKAQALIIAAKYKIHHYLSSTPIDIEIFSQKLGFNPLATLRFLRLLEIYKLVKIIEESKVVATIYTQQLENLSSEHYFKGYIAFEEFLHSLKNHTECWSKKFNEKFYDYLAQHPDVSSNLATYCEKTGKDWIPSILSLTDFSAYRKIIDVGGGNGYLLSLILDTYPSHHGIVFDLPNMLKEAKEFITTLDHNIQKRIQLVSGSFFDKINETADAFLLCRIFLNWSDLDSKKILKVLSSAMTPTSKIIIFDFIMPSIDHPHYARAVMHDLNLLGILGSTIRNRKAWEKLLYESDFDIEYFNVTECNIDHEPNVPFCVIIGKPRHI